MIFVSVTYPIAFLLHFPGLLSASCRLNEFIQVFPCRVSSLCYTGIQEEVSKGVIKVDVGRPPSIKQSMSYDATL